MIEDFEPNNGPRKKITSHPVCTSLALIPGDKYYTQVPLIRQAKEQAFLQLV